MLAKKTKEIVNLKKQLIGTCSCIIIVAVSLKTPTIPIVLNVHSSILSGTLKFLFKSLM